MTVLKELITTLFQRVEIYGDVEIEILLWPFFLFESTRLNQMSSTYVITFPNCETSHLFGF